jgi:ABC-type lipoprotein release transport system permease subunit
MDRSGSLKHINLLFAALSDLIRHRLRSLVVTLCLTAILFPLVTALAISEGLRFQAEIAVKEGADFYISTDLYGGNGPISLSCLDKIAASAAGPHVAARVVGRTYFVDRLGAVLGLDQKSLLALKPLVRGDIPKARGDIVVGEGIVKGFGIKPGPGMRFTVAANNRKVFTPTGTLALSCLWSSDIMIMSLEDANEFFRIKDLATQGLVYSPGRAEGPLTGFLEVLSKGKAGSYCLGLLKIEERRKIHERLKSSYGHKGGIFVVLFVIGAALAIPAFLVTSGFGLRELKKEIGVLKATGWRVKEVLEKAALQNLLISLTAVSLSILISMVCTKVLNGAMIAQFYISEVGLFPNVEIPSRYLPSHGLFCLFFALGVTLVGGLLPAWNKMRNPPSELMR